MGSAISFFGSYSLQKRAISAGTLQKLVAEGKYHGGKSESTKGQKEGPGNSATNPEPLPILRSSMA
jgi:hypothetical protein